MKTRKSKPKPNSRRRYRGLSWDKIGGVKVFTANRDLPEICLQCGKDIMKGARYVASPDITHFWCLKRNRD